ncbi:TetR/AcrR family transcriptional regulator [Mycobacterium talmoniae]|nr:TetR/AcrR family transcriptional regulator [Mycobacterium talmoniae]
MSSASPRLSMEQRRSLILAVAREEFLAQGGYAGARIQAVADAAGVTSALIYKHFESKEVLFEEAIMAPLHELLAARIEEVRTLPPDPTGTAQRESTRRFMRTLLRTFAESVPALGVILFGERDVARRFYGAHFRPLIDAAVEASKANLSRWPHRDFDLETAISAAFGAAFWTALDLSMRGGMPDQLDLPALDAQADRLADLLIDGISAPPRPHE